MVCNGVAGVGASGNTPEKKPVQNAQPKQQEEPTIWEKHQKAGEKVLSGLYDMSLLGMIDDAYDLGIKEHLKDGVKTVRKNLSEFGDKAVEGWKDYTIMGNLYKSIFESDEK